jgi:glyoxylate/hydroxypyruvate reductase A
MGAIAYISRDTDGVAWRKVFTEAFGPIDFRTIAEGLGNTDEIEIALAWKPRPGLLRSLKNLKMIVSLGMGVDHLLADDQLPDVPITRIMDEGLIGQMAEWAIFWALWHHRDIEKYAASQRARQWKPEEFVDSLHRPVGVMGLGSIGQDTAQKFAMLGFPTMGWSRTSKSVPGVETFNGREALPQFLGRCAILVNVLPLTRETRGLLDRNLFAALPKGAFVINMGRGAHVVDHDLLAALESGQLAGAALDVFNTEPLPAEHPYWLHPKVHMTPHMAGYTNPRTASPGVIENIRRLRAGQPLINTVDAKTGY